MARTINMPIQKISIQQLIAWEDRYPILDVRSPGEYAHGHIPGAYSLPLFTDEERKVVGTAYKQESQQEAIKKGLAYFGGRMVEMVGATEKIIGEDKTVIVHCWRGGMRSAGVAWLLDLYGFNVYTLTGGYKSFRRWCVAQFGLEYAFRVLGGFTGSGKTLILEALRAEGQRVIDLEALAAHKGSVFGHLGEPPQPTQEMFENRLALALAGAVGGAGVGDDASGAMGNGIVGGVGIDATGSGAGGEVVGDDAGGDAADRGAGGAIWIEDESQRIGRVNIPVPLYHTIQCGSLFFLEIPFEQRLQQIVREYGQFEKAALAGAIDCVKKRLGGQETKTALHLLEEGDISGCFAILLKYYDKFYLKGLQQRSGALSPIQRLPCDNTDAAGNAKMLLRQQHGVPNPDMQ